MTALQVIITAALGLITAVGGWVVAIAVRREQTKVELAAKSGSIRSTEADKLWDEQEKLREYLTERLEDRDLEIAKLALEVADCRRVCADCRRETEECERRERALKELVNGQADRLASALARLAAAGL